MVGATYGDKRLSGQQGRRAEESGQTEPSTMSRPLSSKDLVENRSLCLCCCSDHPSTFTSPSACRRTTPSTLVRGTVGLNAGEGGEGVRCKDHSQILTRAFVPTSGHGLFSQNRSCVLCIPLAQGLPQFSTYIIPIAQISTEFLPHA